ncbi:hypothetical protein D3C73_1441500 [compost metagenome]
MQGPQPGLLQPRVQLDLVYRGDNFGLLHEFFKVSGLEIGNTDRPHLAFTVEGLHGFVAFRKKATAGTRPMNEVKVHVVEAKV